MEKKKIDGTNQNNWIIKIQTDNGPIFTEKYSKLNTQQKEQLKALLSALLKYHRFQVYV
jgi:hypothetical protein